ncbi:hypothetical protein [Marinimicrococcus flavescens]|uniref:Uncharacterized protein n=1 Tax=Marinimicrococcus flavescens TaxID=3031815 RepID=A0AAP3XSH7_9PROT|nr:hypothetical protein [Marinimicrococcus flavescens]
MAFKPAAPRELLSLALCAAVALAVLPSGEVVAIEFDRAEIFNECNATDGDVGLQVFLDAESWKSVSIKRPEGKRILKVTPEDGLRRIGLTELAIEGVEPPLEEVPFSRFRALFPEGDYVFSGTTASS